MIQTFVPRWTLLHNRSNSWVVVAVVLLGLFGLYEMAVDQGFLLSLFQGATAFDTNFIHELVHDARHAAGFPCH